MTHNRQKALRITVLDEWEVEELEQKSMNAFLLKKIARRIPL